MSQQSPEKGVALIEYALVLMLIAAVVVVILALLGPSVGTIFSNIVTCQDWYRYR